jgi:hypothetical protein
MDRRRALMAAANLKSSNNPWEDLPPESTGFGFPLYLNLTKYDADNDEWYRTENSISTALYEWCEQNFVEQKDDFSTIVGYVPITADTKIYINGGLIEEIYKDSGNYYMTGSKLPFENAYVSSWGYMAGSGAKLPSSGGDLYLTLNTTNADNIKAFQLMESEKTLAPNGTYYDWFPSNTNIFVSGEVEKVTFTNARVELADRPQENNFWFLYFENMSEIGVVPVCYLYPNGLLEAYNDD